MTPDEHVERRARVLYEEHGRQLQRFLPGWETRPWDQSWGVNEHVKDCWREMARGLAASDAAAGYVLEPQRKAVDAGNGEGRS